MGGRIKKGGCMKTGEILKRFIAKDGRNVILRTSEWEDLDDLLDYINSLAEEDLDVLPERKRMTRDEEADWLGRRLAEMEKGKVINVVAEADGRVVANSEVNIKMGAMSHVGELGIGVRLGYRDVGIGTEMMRTLIEETRKAGLKVLVLRVFANNNRAIHVYEKVGFKESGRIPKGIYRKDKYIDDLIMTLNL